MRLWLPVVAVTVATWMMKGSGPLALGDRQACEVRDLFDVLAGQAHKELFKMRASAQK